MFHNVQIVLDIYHDWLVLQVDVASTSNTISKKVIFQDLCIIGGQLFQIFLFVQSFYAYQVPHFHHSHSEDLLVIHSLKGTCQDNPLIKPLFANDPIFVHCNVLQGFCFLYITPKLDIYDQEKYDQYPFSKHTIIYVFFQCLIIFLQPQIS